MATIKTWSLATEDLEHIMNQTKEVILLDLAKSEIISREQAEELSRTKVVIVREKSKISQFFTKLLKKGEEERPSIIVGTINLEKSDGEEKQSQDQDEGEAEAAEERD